MSGRLNPVLWPVLVFLLVGGFLTVLLARRGSYDEGRILEPTHPGMQAADESFAGHETVTDRRPIAAERANAESYVATSPTSRETRTFRATGVVRDDRGVALGGVEVGSASEAASRARSTADGTFALELRRSRATLVAVDADWVTLRAGDFSASEPERRHELVVAPARPVDGWVVDVEGRAVAEARVELVLPIELSLRGGDSFPRVWSAPSAADGRFSLAHAPAIEGARLTAAREGYLPAGAELPAAGAASVQLVLEPAPGPSPILGSVVHADGAPAPEATVLLGRARTRSDAEGAFRLEPSLPLENAPLVAVAPGYLPAVVHDFAAPVRLVLGGPALVIEGRVLGPEGRPLKHWEVRVVDGTPAGPGPEAPTLEALAESAPRPPRTNKEGRFVIGGLADRSYLLRAFGSGSPGAVQAGPFDAGRRDVELVVPAVVAAGSEVPVPVAEPRRFVFESASAEAPPDAIVAIDAAGRHLPLESGDRALVVSTRAPLRAGRSAVLTVAGDARELVVLRGARELGRVGLTLVPGEATVVRWPW